MFIIFLFIHVKTILYIEKQNFIYSFFGISLCPYGKVFIPSIRI